MARAKNSKSRVSRKCSGGFFGNDIEKMRKMAETTATTKQKSGIRTQQSATLDRIAIRGRRRKGETIGRRDGEKGVLENTVRDRTAQEWFGLKL